MRHAGFQNSDAGLRTAIRRNQNLKHARGLTSEAVAVIRAHLDLQPNCEKAAKTMVIDSVVSDAGLRRSEAAVLLWADIERESDGSGRITIRLSKTDPTGADAVIVITCSVMADLDRLHELQETPAASDSVFGIGDR